MNTRILLITSVICALSMTNTYGQVNSNESEDTTHINLKNTTIIIIDKENKNDSTATSRKDEDKKKDDAYKHWSGVMIGVNSLINQKNSIAPPAGFGFLELEHGSSLGTQLNFYEKQFNLGTPHVKFLTGFGMHTSSLEFKNKISLTPGTDDVQAINTGYEYKYNTLTTTGFTIPLMLAFNTHKNEKGVHFAIGVQGSVNAWIYQRQKYWLNGEKHKVQLNNDYNIQRWNATLISTLGISDWATFFATYQLNPYFERNAGNPEVHYASLGLRLFPF